MNIPQRTIKDIEADWNNQQNELLDINSFMVLKELSKQLRQMTNDNSIVRTKNMHYYGLDYLINKSLENGAIPTNETIQMEYERNKHNYTKWAN